MAGDEKLNEAMHAKLISDSFNTNHTTIEADPLSENN